MDLKLFASTFVAIFLAELGDKTQLTVLSMSAATKSRWSVFAGGAALIAALYGFGLMRLSHHHRRQRSQSSAGRS